MKKKKDLPAGRQVEFKVGHETLRGSLFIPKGNGPFPGIVFYHGRGSSRKRYLPMAKRLARAGILALAFDFRGCGKSDGVFEQQTQRMGIDDAKAGLNFLLEQNVDKERIGIMGTSFGGFVTAILMNEFDYIKSLVLRVPAIFPEEIMDINVDDLRKYSYIEKEK
ncbi:MAG: alpha/beta fold hydrolase, partial [Candidatus Levybacteria bacterium]|nr:alpha/beta fold hydrolase [Candidatus Levybacteria bacterium]